MNRRATGSRQRGRNCWRQLRRVSLAGGDVRSGGGSPNGKRRLFPAARRRSIGCCRAAACGMGCWSSGSRSGAGCGAATLGLARRARGVPGGRRAGGARSGADVLSAGGRGLGRRSRAADRRAAADSARRNLGGGPIAALAGGGGGVDDDRPARRAATSAGCNWRPKRAARWACCVPRRLRAGSRRGRMCGWE